MTRGERREGDRERERGGGEGRGGERKRRGERGGAMGDWGENVPLVVPQQSEVAVFLS